MDLNSVMLMLRESVNFFILAFIELMLLFVGISFLVGVINEFLPYEKVEKIMSGRKGRGYLVGAGLGALTPFCSCSTIPITIGLLKAGAGFGPSMSFLFASPLVNPVIVGLFFTAFGLKITVSYTILSFSMSIIAGVVLNKLGFARYIRPDVWGATKDASCGCHSEQPQLKSCCLSSISLGQPVTVTSIGTAPISENPCCPGGTVSAGAETLAVPSRWARIFNEAVAQFRTFLPYIAIGVGVGALFYGFVPSDFVIRYAGPDNAFAVPAAAVIGVPLYVRASTMVPIAISLIEKGMSLGAVLALVIGGAGASIPEVVMLKRLFKMPFLAAFLLSVFGIAVSAGYLLNLLG